MINWKLIERFNIKFLRLVHTRLLSDGQQSHDWVLEDYAVTFTQTGGKQTRLLSFSLSLMVYSHL